MSPASPFPTLGGMARRSGDALPTLTRCAAPLALMALVTTWPWTGFQRHAHWAAFELTPFAKGLRPLDLATAIVVFALFGAAFGWGGTTVRRLRRAAAWGFVCALLVEFAQVYTHAHVASVTDLAVGTSAAWLGAYWAVRRHRGVLAASGDYDPAFEL